MAATQNPIRWYANKLKSETFAGGMLMLGAFIALIWANSPWREAYSTISNTTVGPGSLHLDLSIATWASDGLLAIFFFVVGLELKTEFVTGSLRDMRQALVPMIAAVGGIMGPILVYITLITISGSGNYDGWAIPVATDIAFALAVLGLFGKGLPTAARTFLLTLAVVDDLLGITVIAIFFTSEINFLWLAASFAATALFAVLVNKRVVHWWLLWPIAIFAWVAMHSSGVHATIAGVLMGLSVPAIAAAKESKPLTEYFGEKFDFWSSGIVLPIFAFFAAGVNIVDSGGLGDMLTHPVAIAIYLALPVGKFIGIWGGTALLTKVFKLKLGKGLNLGDISAISIIAGIGFTVSLLIAQLSFDPSLDVAGYARVAVIVGTIISAIVGAFALRIRARVHANDPATAHDATSDDIRLDGRPNLDPDEETTK
ncbi:MAG: Na+/H+ antiporter NhaA [Flaviflexus sp.]|uniref:Na+/H+ antiporter NhaA n=1 Tax=Flaviflexus sp. TaxID=1969482 RepID=UPI00352CA583